MILIIRPKIDFDIIVSDLQKSKYKFHNEPFMYFKKLSPKIRFDPNCFYLISSLQAIKFLKLKKKFIQNGNFLVIGQKVKKGMQSIGVKKIHHVFKDSYDLLNFVKKEKYVNHIHHLTGTVANEVLNEINKKKLKNYKSTKVYKVLFKKKLSKRLRKLIASEEIVFMLHYSLKVSEVFFKKNSQNEKIWFKKKIYHLCMSPRIAKGLQHLGVSKTLLKTSKKPNNKSLLLLLKHI